MDNDTTTQIIEKTEAAIRTIADQIGAGADYFWPILVRQQVIEGILEIGAILLGFLISFALACFVYKQVKKLHKIQNDDPWFEPIVLVPLLIGGFFFFISTICLLAESSCITKICNPEYHALESIASMIR